LLNDAEKRREAEQVKIAQNAIDVWLDILTEEGVLFPGVALAQIMLETGVWSSKIYKENHNMFGMKASSRNFHIGSKHGHANYPHNPHSGSCKIECYLPSIKDYAAWQRQMIGNRKIETNEEYLHFLDNLPGNRRYAEDPAYTRKLRKYLNIIKICISLQETE
jgi:flagellum-specific peptidoglycan hydrolase FlgJ